MEAGIAMGRLPRIFSMKGFLGQLVQKLLLFPELLHTPKRDA